MPKEIELANNLKYWKFHCIINHLIEKVFCFEELDNEFCEQNKGRVESWWNNGVKTILLSLLGPLTQYIYQFH